METVLPAVLTLVATLDSRKTRGVEENSQDFSSRKHFGGMARLVALSPTKSLDPLDRKQPGWKSRRMGLFNRP